MAYIGPRLVCDHCRRELLHEQDVIENEAGVFHRGECYRTAVTVCDACGDPILDDYRLERLRRLPPALLRRPGRP
jgi:hypothetical protein